MSLNTAFAVTNMGGDVEAEEDRDKENWPRGILWVVVTWTAYLLFARCSRDRGAWWAAVYGVAQSRT